MNHMHVSLYIYMRFSALSCSQHALKYSNVGDSEDRIERPKMIPNESATRAVRHSEVVRCPYRHPWCHTHFSSQRSAPTAPMSLSTARFAHVFSMPGLQVALLAAGLIACRASDLGLLCGPLPSWPSVLPGRDQPAASPGTQGFPRTEDFQC